MSDIQHAHLYGMREAKYDWLSTHDVNSTDWNEIELQKPFHLFIPQDNNLLGEYQYGHKITEIVPLNGWGIATRKDSLLTDFARESIVERASILVNGTLEEAYAQGVNDNNSWSFSKIKSKLNGDINNRIYSYYYRPFDYRYIFYEPLMIERGDHRLPIAKHFLQGNSNLSLLVSRTGSASGSPVWDVVFAGSGLSDLNLFRRGGAFIFPLYIYPDKNDPQTSTIKEQRRPNFSYDFLTEITNKLSYTPTPEAIFYYIYAIFHSPTYRTRYAEFLKIDFPRVPLTSDDRLFRKLGEYGEELVALHLMKSPKLDQHLTQIIDKGGEFVVDAGHPKYTDGEVIINKKGDRFTGVPKSVWEFYVGGYQVCHKWLKDRKGRQLSPEDLNHYQKIIVALSETMQIMNAIVAAIPSFPIE